MPAGDAPAAPAPEAAPAAAPEAAPAAVQPQDPGQPGQQPYRVAPNQVVDLDEVYQVDPEFKELTDWLDGMRKLIGPYWEAQRLLQQKLLDLGVTNMQSQAPEIFKLFQDLNG
jgi:hypothetical protein